MGGMDVTTVQQKFLFPQFLRHPGDSSEDILLIYLASLLKSSGCSSDDKGSTETESLWAADGSRWRGGQKSREASTVGGDGYKECAAEQEVAVAECALLLSTLHRQAFAEPCR